MNRAFDPTFGHWLAGFIAGEGYFGIHSQRNTWEIEFSLSLRDDDADVLYEIQHQLDCGKIGTIPARGRSKSQVIWRVSTLEDQLRLIHVLDQFSLRARKAKDYQVWRRAVFAKAAKNYTRVGELAQELKLARAYPNEPIVIDDIAEAHKQLYSEG